MAKKKGINKGNAENRDLPKIVIGRKKKKKVVKKKSNRKPPPTILPWMTNDEWNRACRMFQGSDYGSILQQLMQWKLRVNALPVGAEMTVYVAQALHFDSQDEGLPEQELMLRTLYSLALVRFVNHIGYFANRKVNGLDLPLSALAAQTNVPSWLVALGNEAIHGAVVPPIVILRIAGECMRNWLGENYWTIINSPEQLAEDDAKGGDLEQSLGKKAREIISAYMATRIYKVRKIKNIEDIEITKFCDSDKIYCTTTDAMTALKRAINIGVEMDPCLLCFALANKMTSTPEIYKEFGNTFPDNTFDKLTIVWNPILNLLKRKNKLATICQEFAKLHVSTEEASDIKHFRYLSGQWLKIILRTIRDTGERGKYSKEFSSTVLPIISKAPNSRTPLFINELLYITTSDIGARRATKQRILNAIWNNIISVGSNRSNTDYTIEAVEDILLDNLSIFLALSPAAKGRDKSDVVINKNIPPEIQENARL